MRMNFFILLRRYHQWFGPVNLQRGRPPSRHLRRLYSLPPILQGLHPWIVLKLELHLFPLFILPYPSEQPACHRCNSKRCPSFLFLLHSCHKDTFRRQLVFAKIRDSLRPYTLERQNPSFFPSRTVKAKLKLLPILSKALYFTKPILRKQ